MEATKRRKRLAANVALAAVIIAALSAAGIAPLFRPAARSHRNVALTIPAGANVTNIGNILEQKGVIRSAWAFGWYARFRGDANKLKSGRYTLSPDMTLAQITARLKEGGEKLTDDRIRVTIPEGYILRQVAEAFDKKGIVDKARFLQAATTTEGIETLHADFPLPKKTLEGYLFPDTYFFRKDTPSAQVIETMLANFSSRFVRPYQGEIERSGRSLHHLVTKGSLIEREARVQEDRPRIAGVIDNRLKRGIRLEVDATVLYALGQHKERVLYKDLEVDSPYNTYRHKGLPPGPIANPGLAALLAALRPEKNDFLFYVARPDGTHIFSRNVAGHEAAKRQARAERQQSGAEVSPGG